MNAIDVILGKTLKITNNRIDDSCKYLCQEIGFN